MPIEPIAAWRATKNPTRGRSLKHRLQKTWQRCGCEQLLIYKLEQQDLQRRKHQIRHRGPDRRPFERRVGAEEADTRPNPQLFLRPGLFGPLSDELDAPQKQRGEDERVTVCGEDDAETPRLGHEKPCNGDTDRPRQRPSQRELCIDGDEEIVAHD